MIRLRSQVREIELQAETQIQSRMSAAQTVHQDFDPLELDRFTRFQELTRSLAEGVNDVSTVQQSLLRNLDDADAALLAQARLSREVQQRLFAIRTVPFGSLSERLYRILRSTARELDKRANLEIHGGQTELDRSVLEKLVGPLEHLLRNALDHGLEPRDARAGGRQGGNRRDLAHRPADRQRSADRARRRWRRHRFHRRSPARAFARHDRRRRRAHRAAADRVPVQAGLLDRGEGDADLRARHRHGRRARGDRRARRSRRSALEGGRRHAVHAVPAAHACRRASRAGARGRAPVGVAGADGRAGAADQGGRAHRPLRVAQGRMEGPLLRVPLPAAAPGRHATPSRDAADQLGAAAAHRPGRGRDPRRRDGGQPGSRREEHRPAARARVGHLRRDGARQRRDRADHQSRAARDAPGCAEHGDRRRRRARDRRSSAAPGRAARRARRLRS